MTNLNLRNYISNNEQDFYIFFYIFIDNTTFEMHHFTYFLQKVTSPRLMINKSNIKL